MNILRSVESVFIQVGARGNRPVPIHPHVDIGDPIPGVADDDICADRARLSALKSSC